MKKIISGFVVFMLAFGSCALAQASAQAFPPGLRKAQGQGPDSALWQILTGVQEPAPAFTAYQVEAESIPSIDGVVGVRQVVSSEEGITEGRPYVLVSYQSESIQADLQAYVDFLIGEGWVVTRLEGDASGGVIQMATESVDASRLLLVTAEYAADSYSILAHQTGGTLRRYTDDAGNRLGEITYAGVPAEDTAADPVLVERGKAALDAGAYEEALDIYDQALARHPGVAEYQGGRGEALVELGRYEEAIASLNDAIRLDPDHWEYVNNRGVAFFFLDRLEEALADFERAVELGPDDDDTYYNLAIAQYNLDLASEAVYTLMAGLDVFPESVELWELCGDVLYSYGVYGEAVFAYDMAAAHGGFDAQELPYYLDAMEQAGDMAEGMDIAEELPGDVTDALEETAGVPDQTGNHADVPPLPPASESRLMNYEEWLLEAYEIVPFGQEVLAGIMNRFLHSQVYENGIVEEAVEYPREWPSAWLDGVIPPYTGTGWMYDLYAAHPLMSYAPKDLVHVAVTVYDYAPDDVAAYIGMLLAEGLEETHDERYAADWIEQVRSFRGSDFTLNIVFANGESPVMTTLDADELQPMVQFNVDFDREPYVPDMSPTPDTALLNMEAYDIMTGKTSGRELDIMVTSEIDEYGRLNEMVANPSKWPKEILGEFIPEFTLPAVLLRTMLTAPADAPAPEETLIYSIGLVAFMPEVPDAYAQELIAFGYREVPPEEYDADTAAQAQEYGVYRLFTLPGVRLYLCVDEFNGAEELMLSLYFDGRLNAFWNQ